MAKMRGSNVTRRGLLKGAAVAGAVAAAAPLKVAAQTAAPPQPARGGAPMPNMAMETGIPAEMPLVQGRSGSDYMVDVIQSLGIDQIAANPGTSFRGLHESLVNYSKLEWHTCTHEELSVAMAHGYAKIENKPMLVLMHGTVGLQHGSMAIYNAWCDQVPIYMMAGNTADATKRGSGANWAHSVQDAAIIVRDYVKWDDFPASLQHFGESAVRAYKFATTPPYEPVLLVIDSELQDGPVEHENPREKLTIPKLPNTAAMVGDPGAVTEAARLLVNAEFPVLVAGRAARTQAGIDRMVELADLLQCAVVDTGDRMNFPTRHPLNHTDRARQLYAQADVIMGLEVFDFHNTTHQFHDNIEAYTTPTTKPGAKLISMTPRDLFMHANYQDFGRFADVDLSIPASVEATLPYLTEAVRKLLNDDRKAAFAERGKKLAAAGKALREQARADALFAWDASPIATGRMCAEIYEAIRDVDWSLGSTTNNFVSAWPARLWDMTKHYHNTGGSGGSGIGYCAPAATGAAVANKKHGRITVSINPDGDLMYGPGILWTAAHSQLPILYVMHNNRAYHQEIMGIQRMANRRQRGIDRTHIGVTLRDPYIDYATVAKGMGVASFGPISDAKDLGPALKKAVEIVKRGEPALVDVVTQGR